MTLNEWLPLWLETCIKFRLKPRTYQKYADAARLRILPGLGKYELDDLSPAVLQAHVAGLAKRYSANTVIGVISVIKLALTRAQNVGLINRHFADCIQYPKHVEKRIDFLLPDEQKQVERNILKNKQYKLYGVVLCLYTGLRIGELMALKWEDIDLANGFISVTKTRRDVWSNGRYKPTEDTPKTLSSVRVIPIPRQLTRYIAAVKEQSLSEYFVSGCRGSAVSIRSYQRSFRLLLQRLNIRHIGFHGLRHTFATRALECGMDVKSLSEILGHKSPAITLSRYVHSHMAYKRAMMDILGKNLL